MSSNPTSPHASNSRNKPAGGELLAFDYIAPFAIFVGLLALRRVIPLTPELFASLRFVVVTATLAVFSPRVIPWPPAFLLGTIVLGAALFGIWIGPDVLWPGYRDFWLFHNSLTGAAASSLPPRFKANAFFIALRVVESTVLVPIVEELFWRGWLLRWLIRSHFQSVEPGTYTPFSFWAVAVLFAFEHGPYWEVGLIAGVAYNWWMVHTRSLADCILAHAVTNGLLAAYVLLFDKWQYWL
ncbi:MAG: CAAX prenyl protease-related protein [Bryobacteraceae bacterium]|jgi:CAAX prenyl protease-like protein